jgi:hypothetical protein
MDETPSELAQAVRSSRHGNICAVWGEEEAVGNGGASAGVLFKGRYLSFKFKQ